jgi:XTP/dITP diphosphohydrolase
VKQALTLIIATGNAHKVEEIQSILGDEFVCRSLREFPPAPKVVEDAGTFAGNATKKSVAIARWLAKDLDSQSCLSGSEFPERAPRVAPLNLFVLADDSGLEVDALGGEPGVNSARFAALNGSAGVSAANAPDAANNAKLLQLLQNVPPEKRTARFRCLVGLTPVSPPVPETASPVCDADEMELRTEIFEGICEGHIQFAPRGQRGFGYDPLFVPRGYEQSFAELGEDVKNRISHRAQALQKLKRYLLRREPGM